VSRSSRRKRLSSFVVFLCASAVVIALVPLAFIFFYVVKQGFSSLSWDFFTKMPKPVGEAGGGMANAILGTLMLIGIASGIAIPVGMLCGVHLAEFAGGRFASFVRFTADVLNGVPSIVIGIFAYTVIVLPQKHFSTLAGGLALGVMMIPIAVRSTEEFLRAVPASLREGAVALGASKTTAILTVVIPAAKNGIMTGIMLNLARVAGETAPLLFTSFSNRYWSPGWEQPTAALPVMIFTYAIAPYEDWHQQAWSAGFVLLTLVLVVNIAARLILSKTKHVAR
jgi:phosphate transport system permease protein